MLRPMIASQHSYYHSHLKLPAAGGLGARASAGLNLKKWAKIGLVCRKNSQLLEIAAFCFWGT